MRVIGFIDGFNLYHPIDESGLHHYKWCDLRKLCKIFAPDPQWELTSVLFFSAYATWRKDACQRHEEYVRALEAVGVTPMMGDFKRKYRKCYACGNRWQSHEEKETDVAIATQIILGAFKDTYDRALIVSADSDLVPALEVVIREFPSKSVRVLTPPFRRHSMELYQTTAGQCRRILPQHLKLSMLPKDVRDSSGNIVAMRPQKYDPPE